MKLKRLGCLTVLAISLAAVAVELHAEAIRSLRGELLLEAHAGESPASLTVEVVESTRATAMHFAPVTAASTFELRDLETGFYRIRVVDLQNNVLHEEHTMLTPATGILQVRMKRLPASGPPGGTISAAALAVPSKASREFFRAQQAFRAGKSDNAVRHLERAIELFPDYAEARVNLGARYYAQKHYEKAAAEFEAAARLQPRLAPAHSNLALALAALGKLEEAERAARRGLSLTPASAKCNYALALILLARGKRDEETLALLRLAAAEHPRAHALAVELLKAAAGR